MNKETGALKGAGHLVVRDRITHPDMVFLYIEWSTAAPLPLELNFLA